MAHTRRSSGAAGGADKSSSSNGTAGGKSKASRKQADLQVDTTPTDASSPGNESDLSPISPPVLSPKTRLNRWKPDPKRRRFKLLRSFTLADFVTLGNCASGTGSIFFCLNYLENDNYDPYIFASFALLPLALIFDIADGSVARYRQNSSPYGSDLDSLADVISFAVAPAVLGFTLGLRGIWDCIILVFFVCCGVSRLARYNVTAETLAGSDGKVKYYEGFPVPTSLALVVLLAIAYWQGGVLDNMWGGSYRWSFPSSLPGTFHPFSLLFLFFGCAMISEWRIPKP